ncbi:MAG: S9 family peptidase, partial [Bacteroidetes bacterium]
MKTRLFLLFILATVFQYSFSQTTDLAPGDNLYVDGVPSIPQSIVQEVGRYTEFRSAGISSWHPKRHEMLISTRFGDVPQVHLVKFPGGARTQLTFFPERVAGASFNPESEDHFVFSKDIGGGEWFQLYRFDIATGDVTLLTDGKSRNLMGPWSHDGKWIAYTSTRRNNKDVDIYIINPSDPSTDKMLLQLEGGGWGPHDWSPDGKTLLIENGISVNESYLYLVDVATGEKKQFLPEASSEQVAFGGVQFSKDGKGVYLTSDNNSEFMRLQYVELATKKATVLTETINWDVNGFDLSPDGKSIVFVTNEDGISVLHL